MGNSELGAGDKNIRLLGGIFGRSRSKMRGSREIENLSHLRFLCIRTQCRAKQSRLQGPAYKNQGQGRAFEFVCGLNYTHSRILSHPIKLIFMSLLAPTLRVACRPKEHYASRN